MAAQSGSHGNVRSDGSDDESASVPLINRDSPDVKFSSNNNVNTPENRKGAPPVNGTPADRVRNLLTPVKPDSGSTGSGSSSSESESEDEGDALGDILGQHYLFCQLNRLCHFPDGEQGWKEISRWLKYEEKVEMGERWSKPHVATSSLHALLEFRKALDSGDAVLDLDANTTHGCLHQLADIMMARLREQGDLSEEQLSKITQLLVSPYKHSNRTGDMGKKKERTKSQKEAAARVECESEKKKKKKKKGRKGDYNEIPGEYHVYAQGVEPSDLKPYKPNKKVQKKVPPSAEVVNLMVGQVDFLDKPIMALARLSKGTVLSGISEVSMPTRFVFLALGPKDDKNIREYEELGRSIGSLFSDKVFAEVAYRAVSRQDIMDGLDEYIDDLTVLPPSTWDPSTRLTPPTTTFSKEGIKKRLNSNKRFGHELEIHEAESGDPTLKRTGRIFGGLIADAKRRYAMYKSDIVDGFHIQCLASVVFLFFACITPIVTFGGLMGTATDGLMGTMECILSGAICGILFAFFAGQPLTIVGATGPLLIFESILYQFCKGQEVDFMAFRFWVGIWSAGILLVFVMFDLSYLVGYITRFTEESFSVLISLIFIMEAFKKIIGIWKTQPVHTDVIWEDVTYKCYCVDPGNVTMTPPVVQPPEGIISNGSDSNYTSIIPKIPFNPYNVSALVYGDCITHEGKVEVNLNCMSTEECLHQDWSLMGSACDDHGVTEGVGDVFLLSMFLFFGTFVFAMFFRNWRTASCFPSVVRNRVADFAVLMSILINTGTDIAFGLDTPKLDVPAKFATTVPGRGWIVNPGALGDAWYYAILAVLPAILGTILIFLDQQITAVIINRKDHKLKKGPGYHLDLFVLAITIVICSTLGLPWFVAATVRSITHLKSLVKQSETSAPGETPTFEGIREQRVTGICIHLLIAVSVLCTPILKYVPMPVLYGVFLYMGVTSLGGVQFIERIKIMLMPAKYQPDYIYLRHVPTKRVHIFTGIQIVCMVGMWVVKSIKKIAILFPLLVLMLCFVRKAMDFWYFTQQDMYWVDHILPEGDRRKKEDELLAAAEAEGEKLTFDKGTPWPPEEKDSKTESTSSLKKEKVDV